MPIKVENDFIILACDGIWDCFTNEEAIKYAIKCKKNGPKTVSPSKARKSDKGTYNNSPLKSDAKKGLNSHALKGKNKGETSFIIEEMMD